MNNENTENVKTEKNFCCCCCWWWWWCLFWLESLRLIDLHVSGNSAVTKRQTDREAVVSQEIEGEEKKKKKNLHNFLFSPIQFAMKNCRCVTLTERSNAKYPVASRCHRFRYVSDPFCTCLAFKKQICQNMHTCLNANSFSLFFFFFFFLIVHRGVRTKFWPRLFPHEFSI